MPCQTVTVLGSGVNIEFTQFDVTPLENAVRVVYTVKSNYSVEVEVEIAVGLDRDGNGLLEGSSEVVNFDDHVIPPGGTSQKGRTIDLDGIPEGGESDVTVCAQPAGANILG